MKNYSYTPEISDQEINDRAASLIENGIKTLNQREILPAIMGMIDLTTLEGADTDQKVADMCEKGKSISTMGLGLPNVAAVCVYPTLVQTACRVLEGTGIRIAAVAGAFPAGQSPIHIKVAEVKYTVEQGAEEIDMVISRGKFLQGEYNLVFDEIAAIKEACGSAHLKVILETGELKTATNIRRASEIAIDAGGDFIKTSTGKVQPVATEHAMLVMLETINDHFRNTGKRIGIKPAGGFTSVDIAMRYYALTQQVIGKEWLNNNLYRYGASKLVDSVIEAARG